MIDKVQVLAQKIDTFIDRYPAGWVEVFADVSIQLTYLALGLVVEWIRPSYNSKSSKKMVLQSLRNHAAGVIMHVCSVFYMRGEPMLTRTFLRPYSLPSWGEVVGDVFTALVLRDVVCYTIHRLWHMPGVYKHIHAKHHQILDPREHHVWTVSYMSFADFLFLYACPVMAIAKVLEMNIVTVAAFALISSVGEQWNLVYGNQSHDDHHATGKLNYGVYGIMDTILGTSGAGKKLAKVENAVS